MSDCVGCGYCCLKVPCPIAIRIYGMGVSVCPELQWNGIRHVCRLVMLPDPLSAEYRQDLSIGAGCCSSLNTWRKEVINRIPQKELEPKQIITPEFQDFLVSLGTQSFISGDALWLTIWGFKKMLEKRGYSKEEAEKIGEHVNHYVRQNRKSMVENFIG